MLISPPFLPAPVDGESDVNFLTRAMPSAQVNVPGTNIPEGSYPVSLQLGWHGGMHLYAGAGNTVLPVRAIADGEVVFVRPPTQQTDAIDHPLNYNPYGSSASWTDDGLVILRHTTDIGSGAQAEAVVFYSLYAHLSAIPRAIRTQGTRVYRKDTLGDAGQIYGANHHIHFEILCDDNNLRKLLGRTSGDLALTADGRSDAVYGSIYFHLPAGSRFYAQCPALHTTDPGVAPVFTNTTPQIVSLTYQTGSAIFKSLDLSGQLIDERTDVNAEYDLYQHANDISDAFRRANTEARRPNDPVPAPSACYELLRFGRIINTEHETLSPANTPHWRQVNYPGGAGWVNLNEGNVRKFSDADFPHWSDWKLIADDTDDDSRCESAQLIGLIEETSQADGRLMRDELQQRIGNETVRNKLRKTICKFPSEWNCDGIDARWGWLQTDPEFGLQGEDWTNFRNHVSMLTVPAVSLPEALRAAHWHFHPRAFIEQFRKCRWLSQSELMQCIPRNSPAGRVELSTASERSNRWKLSINNMARKYCLDTNLRLTHLLSHIWAETGYLRLLREAAAGDAPYAPFVGRGLIQITWEDKYANYNRFAHLTPSLDANFNIELIATDSHHAANSSGFYWVSKEYRDLRETSKINLSRIADEGLSNNSIGKLCLWINGGTNHYDHRHAHAYYIKRVLDDFVYPANPNVERLTFRRMEFLRETVTSNGRTSRRIVGTQQSHTQIAINIDYSPQR